MAAGDLAVNKLFKNRRFALLAGVLGLLTLWLAWPILVGIGYAVVGFVCGEPFFDGKPASYWVRDLRISARWNLWDRVVLVNRRPDDQKARAALRQMGAPAVPTLVRALQSSNASVRSDAAWLVAAVGPDARAAVPVLVGTLKDKDPYVRIQAAVALGRLGSASESVPALIEALKDPDAGGSAAAALGKIGPEAHEAIPVLIELLRKNPRQIELAKGLAGIGVAAVPPLIELLKGPDKSVWIAAADALGQIGPPAKAAVPLLERGFVSGNTTSWSPDALKKIDPEAVLRMELVRKKQQRVQELRKPRARDIPELLMLLKERDEFIKMYASLALSRLGPQAKAAVPELTELLQEQNTGIRLNAALALASIGPEASAAAGALAALLTDKEHKVRQNALLALSQFGPEALPALPALVGLLSDQHSQVRAHVAIILAQIGPPAHDGVPALFKAIKDNDEHVRLHVAEALWNIKRLGDAVVPVLIDLAQSGKQPKIRTAAVRVLGKIGPDAKAAIPTLRALVEDLDPNVAKAAAEEIPHIYPGDPSCRDGLVSQCLPA